MLWLSLLIFIIQGVIWGFATKAVITNKGYSENWFWWGFFFGLIALLVALSKPERKSGPYGAADRYSAPHTTYDRTSRQESAAPAPAAPSLSATETNKILRDGGWRCSCGRINPSYTGTCACGRNKAGQLVKDTNDTPGRTDQLANETKTSAPAPIVNAASEALVIENLKKYKELLDSGALSTEEFEKKKAQLLGL